MTLSCQLPVTTGLWGGCDYLLLLGVHKGPHTGPGIAVLLLLGVHKGPQTGPGIAAETAWGLGMA
jgi:hypothetical protein